MNKEGKKLIDLIFCMGILFMLVLLFFCGLSIGAIQAYGAEIPLNVSVQGEMLRLKFDSMWRNSSNAHNKFRY